MKPKYQQAHNIKAPWWMNEAQQDHYRIKKYHKQKIEQTKLARLENLNENEKIFDSFIGDTSD